MSGHMPGGGGLESHQPPETTGTDGSAPRQRSLRFDVAWIGALGIILYVLLRFPFSVFYSQLGTTPEEVGLTYSQTLTQSSAAVMVIFVLVGIFAWSFLTYIRHTVRGVMAGRGPTVSRRYLSRLDDQSYEEHLQRLREFWSRTPADLATFHREMPLRSWLREFDKLKKPDNRQRGEARRTLRALSSGDHITKRPMAFLVFSAASVAVVLLGFIPMIARDEAGRLRQCLAGDSIPGFRFAGPHAQLFTADAKTEAFADRHLFLLGGDSSRYILYDCTNQTLLRVPNSSYIVVNSTKEP